MLIITFILALILTHAVHYSDKLPNTYIATIMILQLVASFFLLPDFGQFLGLRKASFAIILLALIYIIIYTWAALCVIVFSIKISQMTINSFFYHKNGRRFSSILERGNERFITLVNKIFDK